MYQDIVHQYPQVVMDQEALIHIPSPRIHETSLHRQRRCCPKLAWKLRITTAVTVILLSLITIWFYTDNTQKRNALEGIHSSMNHMIGSLKSLEESGRELDSDIYELKKEITSKNTNLVTSDHKHTEVNLN